MHLVPVCPLSDLDDSQKKLVQVGGRPVALFRVEANVFAIDDTCPHRGGPLSQGDLEGHVVHCPLHAWAFDVRTGECTSPGNAEVFRYETRVEGGTVFVAKEGTRAHPAAVASLPYDDPTE
jgi:nitrite reductase (NADH) small subunit